MYKGTKSSLRPVEDVLADVDAMAAAAEVLRRRGVAAVHEGLVPQRGVPGVAVPAATAARTVFLQDADPCAVKPEKLAAVIRRVRERFPSVERVTTYGRASTLARRTPEDLALLVDAGLTRVHLGLESGADEVLMAIDKGCTGGDLDRRRGEGAARRPRALLLPDAGAGRARGRRRARRGLRPRDPRGGRGRARRATRSSCACARRRSSRARRSREREAAGEFVLPDDVEVAQELRDLLEQLGDARLELRSDHMLNLLQELEGSLPRDRERLIAMLDEYLGWPRDDQARFAVGVRLGLFRRLADYARPRAPAALERQFDGYAQPGADELLQAASALRSRYI